MQPQPKPNRPELLEIGALQLVMPDAAKRLTPIGWADLGLAVILQNQGKSDDALATIARLEERLGVNPAHRRALAVGPDAVRADIAARHQRLEKVRHGRAKRLNYRLAGPSEIVQAKVAAAERHEATARDLRAKSPYGNHRAIKDHRRAAKLLRKEAAEIQSRDGEQHWRDAAAQESEAFARLRAEDIGVERATVSFFATDEDGRRLFDADGKPVMVDETVERRVMLSRGSGFKRAYQDGKLDGGRGAPKEDWLWRVGQTYHEAFEVRENLRSGHGEGGGFGPKGPQLRWAEAGEVLKIMRRGQARVEIDVLDAICGRELSIDAVAKSFRSGSPRIARLLRNGLRVAGENYAVARKTGEAGQIAERLRGAAEVLRAAGNA